MRPDLPVELRSSAFSDPKQPDDRSHPLLRAPGAPSADRFHLVSTPGHDRGRVLRQGRCHLPRLVPSSRFLSASTAFSTLWPAGLLHPATGCGVRSVRVRIPERWHPSKVSPVRSCLRRHRRPGPPRSLPLPSLACWPCLPGVTLAERALQAGLGSLLPMSSPRGFPRGSTMFRLSPAVSLEVARVSQSVVPPLRFPTARHPFLPWAFSPLRGPHPAAARPLGPPAGWRVLRSPVTRPAQLHPPVLSARRSHDGRPPHPM